MLLACFQDAAACLVAGQVEPLAWYGEVPLGMAILSAGLDQHGLILCLTLEAYEGVCSLWHLITVLVLHNVNPLYQTVMIY